VTSAASDPPRLRGERVLLRGWEPDERELDLLPSASGVSTLAQANALWLSPVVTPPPAACLELGGDPGTLGSNRGDLRFCPPATLDPRLQKLVVLELP
jgi:hypothetical protein